MMNYLSGLSSLSMSALAKDKLPLAVLIWLLLVGPEEMRVRGAIDGWY